MTKENWADVDRIYHEALTREPAERAAFVIEACNGDSELRATIESLLEYEPHARQFLEQRSGEAPRSPIADAVARVRTSSTPGRFVGSAFGAYTLESLIAVGGMGEVYRARDTRLDRKVAIKILPEHFADDPDRRDRFQREARIISSLNHPHICALYDVGEQSGVQYLVMEYIEGETLDQRIRRGRLAVAEAIAALIQIADALDKAHRRGIVHRDLKPGNIMLTKSDVKLLDFGLAARRSRTGALENDLLTIGPSQTLTTGGMIMGTVQYMAPEQLQGLPTDARTDVFAFGAVGYEMLTGKRAFDGSSHAAVIGAILKDEPTPIADVAPEVPSRLAQTLARCLAKDPDERWQTANDLLFELRSLARSSDVAAVASLRPTPRMSWLERALWVGGVTGALAIGAVWAGREETPRQDAATPLAPAMFSVSPAEGGSLSAFYPPFAVSADGRHLAYVAAGSNGVGQLWLRSLNSNQDRRLPGTEGAGSPFWSPDSQWIGFFAENSLKKVRTTTGVTRTIVSNVRSGSATWGARDEILFPIALRGLNRVPADGGPITPVSVEPGNQFSPQFLSDGLHFIYSVPARNAIGLARTDGGSPRTLMTLPVGTSAVGYSRGHIFFAQDGALYVRPFDEQRLDFTGSAKRLVDGVPAGNPARTPFSVSEAGILVYWTNPLGVPAVLRWYDREGHPSTAVPSARFYRGFTLSPDDERVIFSRASATGAEDLWMRRLDDGTEKQISFDSASFKPAWSPDGTRIAYSGFPVRPPPRAYIRDLTSDRPPFPLGTTPFPTFASGWTPDSSAILTVEPHRATDRATDLDLWRQPIDGGAGERLWFNTAANELQGAVSPDGRWIAYVTDESGISEVWIASYPTGTVKRPISRGGGDFPYWADKELFFVTPDRGVAAAQITSSASGVEIAGPRTLFRVPNLVEIDPLMGAAANPFAPASDGRRFLIAERAHDPNALPLTVVVNWPALLKP